MGALCSSSNSHINGFLDKSAKQEKEVLKVLLLGPGSTGKTTLFNALRLCHGKFDKDDRNDAISMIRFNMLDGMGILLDQCSKLYNKDKKLFCECKLTISENEQIWYNKMIKDYKEKTRAHESLNENDLSEITKCIKFLWNLECIQATFHFQSNNFAIADNLPYFYNNCDSIMKMDFKPSDKHILQHRVKSSGVKQYNYDLNNKKEDETPFKKFEIAMTDVGGQKIERNKWLSLFDNVKGMLFVASLVDYQRLTYENSNNCMVECCQVWRDITRLEYFDKTGIILILNKDDLLKQLLCLKDNGLHKCFSENGVWQAKNDDEYWDTKIDEQYWPVINNKEQFEEYHSIVIKFIENLFVNRYHGKTNSFFTHVTVATNQNYVQNLFENIESTVISKNENDMNNNNNINNNFKTNVNAIQAEAIENVSVPSSMVKDENDEHSIIHTQD